MKKIFFKQSIFVSDRTTNMQFSEMQNKIYRPLITIQYNTKCTIPLYPKFTSKKFSVFIFCCNFYLVIAYALIPTTDKCLHPFVSRCTKYRDNFFGKNAQIWHTPANMTTNWRQNTGNNYKIRCHIFD